MTQNQRLAVADVIDALIAMLDAFDAPDEDREPECEDEGAQCDDEGDVSSTLPFGEFRGDPRKPYKAA